MASRHDRGGREAVTAALGERGRRTGAAMPKQGEVPLTQDGFEDPDAFFRSPVAAATASASQSQSNARSKGRNGQQYSPSAGPSNAYSQQQQSMLQQLPSSASKRHLRRPDVTHEIGVRGRKTGMPIAPNGRIARTSDGMEDMNAFFAADPASVPPLQRAKRISQILEEQEGAHPAEEEEDDDDDEDDEDDEDEDEYDEEEDGQTANYGGRGRTSNATSSRRAEESEEEEDEYDEEHTGGYEQGGSQDIDEEDDASRYNTTVASSVHRGRRQSRAQTNADIYNDDDGGTQTMSLEGSSFFNKTTRTIDTIPAPTAKKSRLSTRSDIYDDPPSSPPEQGQQSSSPARSSRQARNAVASTSKQRTQAMNGGSTSDEGENEAVQSSLTRSAQARRRRSNEGRNRGEVSTSPVYDRKGKGRQSLFAAPSSDTNGNSRVEGNEDDDDGYGDEEQGGFEPAGEDGQDGYDNYAAVDGDDYPNGDDNDETGYELPQRRDDDGSEDEAAGGEEDEDDVRSDDDQVHLSDEEDQHIGNPDEQYESDHSVELPPPLSAKNSKAAKNVKPAKAQRKAAANDSGHVDEDKTTHTTPRAKPKPKAAAAAAKQQLKKKQKRVYENPDGLRRSHRDRTSPVAFWRNEHIIYQRKDSPSGVAYYEKVGVADRPKPPVRSLVNRQKRSRSVSQAASNKRAKTRSVSVGTDAAGEDAGPQQGMQQDWSKWDEETDPDGIVWDYVDGKETQRRIVFTSTMLDPKSTRHGYKFQRIFTDGEFMGGGVLIIPPGEKKPLKPAKDNTYMLFCHQGAVRVLVHRTEFSVAQGGFFLIPRGNSYQINNLTDIDAILVFTQAKEVEAIVDAEDEAGRDD